MNYFTSDHHFSHKRVIEFGHRPFKSLEHMERELIKRWNNKVKPSDTVYILGDFNFKGAIERQKLFNQLNGNKVFIKGNHDSSGILLGGYVEVLSKGFELVHNPADSSASRVIHGHIHLPEAKKIHRQKTGRLFINVNVELWDYEPVSIRQIQKLIEKEKRGFYSSKKSVTSASPSDTSTSKIT